MPKSVAYSVALTHMVLGLVAIANSPETTMTGLAFGLGLISAGFIQGLVTAAADALGTLE